MSAAKDTEIRRLYRERPRDRVVFASGLVLAGTAFYAWSSGELRAAELFSRRRLENLERFLGELVPSPLQDADVGFSEALGLIAGWAVELMRDRGWEAVWTTLALSVAAVVLAALAASVLTLPSARTFATAEAYAPSPRPPRRLRRLAWQVLVALTRGLLIFLRAIPEYVWAFLLLAVLGPTAWPVVLALAIHNSGILAKLAAEVVENLEPAPLEALRGLGAGRGQIVVAGLFPLTLPRLLLFFFYRWETCVREATVLGMLGIVSLGYWVVDTRSRQHYDEMFFFVLLGAAIVLAGDLVSTLARELVRRSA